MHDLKIYRTYNNRFSRLLSSGVGQSTKFSPYETHKNLRIDYFIAMAFNKTYNFIHLLSFFFAFPLQAIADEAIGLCCLCPKCQPAVPGRGDLHVDEYGLTCNKLYLQMADPSNTSVQGNSVCLRLIANFRTRCCDSSHKPIPIVQAPTAAPNWGMPRGNEPICNLCRDGSYPTKPFTLVAVLKQFLPNGQYTCEELYRVGLTGNMPDQICKPLVNFVEQPCGCIRQITAPTTTTTPTTKSPVQASPVNVATTPPVPAPTTPAPAPPSASNTTDANVAIPPKKDIPKKSSKEEASKIFNNDSMEPRGNHGSTKKKSMRFRLRGR